MSKAGSLRCGVLTFTLGLAVIFGCAGCHRGSQRNATLFPASNEVSGWVKTSDTRTFAATDLWKYIDGEAERYLKAGVQRASTADYKFQGKIEAVADIYALGSMEGAKKILDSEPTAEAKPVQVGDGARLYSQSLVFRKGSFLVRVVAYQETAEVQQALLDLGRGIEQRLGD